jgi:hypothetical protein
MKLFTIQVDSTRDRPGYNDRGTLYDGVSPAPLWHNSVSACPNPDMFCVMDGQKKKIWKPMLDMTVQEHLDYCIVCNRRYCSNWRGYTGEQDYSIACRNYGQIAYTTAGASYRSRFIPDHKRFGTCLLLEEGRKIPSLTPSSFHQGQSIITEVFVHAGENDHWRVSAACITVPLAVSEGFFRLFKPNEPVSVFLVGMTH